MKKCILMFALLLLTIILAVVSEAKDDHSLLEYGMLEEETSGKSSMLSQNEDNLADVFADRTKAAKK